ncbi:MAG: hypothetical protein M3024_16645 [Candidatus Dormibacteraeota bacterium]|nr:hypothetical protein [Candidatus Dormibacteraeota bacterium]
MAGGEIDHGPTNWERGDPARTLQLSLHHRMLADFERIRSRARLVIICPLLPPTEGISLKRE